MDLLSKFTVYGVEVKNCETKTSRPDPGSLDVKVSPGLRYDYLYYVVVSRDDDKTDVLSSLVLEGSLSRDQIFQK